MDIYDQNIELLTGDLQYERFGMALFLSVSARCFYSQCCAEIGMFAEGQRYMDEAIRIAEAKSHPHSLIRAYYINGCLAFRQGCLARAIAALERGLKICREADIPLLLPGPMFQLGAAYALAGRLSEALDLQEQTVTQHNADEGMMLVLLGETYLLSNRLDKARVCVKRALTFARAHNERACQAWGLRLSGAVMYEDNVETTQAEVLYQEALQLAEELRMKPLQAHCHRDLGLLYSRTGQSEQAHAELSMAIKMYRDMEMKLWLPETERRLAELKQR
jgi:tetratricopeptide (TPR) repeat protein